MSRDSALFGPFQDRAWLDFKVSGGFVGCEPFGLYHAAPISECSPTPIECLTVRYGLKTQQKCPKRRIIVCVEKTSAEGYQGTTVKIFGQCAIPLPCLAVRAVRPARTFLLTPSRLIFFSQHTVDALSGYECVYYFSSPHGMMCIYHTTKSNSKITRGLLKQWMCLFHTGAFSCPIRLL